MRRSNKQNYIAWAARYRWRWLGVLTFRKRVAAKTALELARNWVHTIELAESRPISWLAIPERGDKGRLHVHILVAGIRSRLLLHMAVWNALAGHCHLVLFDPNHEGGSGAGNARENRGIAYALKSLRSDDYELDGQLHDRHLLPRFAIRKARSRDGKASLQAKPQRLQEPPYRCK
jgi:hypothetical protein